MMKRALGWSFAGALLAVAACSDGVGFSGPKEAERWGTMSRSQVQPDLTGDSWVGWTYVGTNCELGIYAKGSHCTSTSPEGYKIYTAVFESTGPFSGNGFNKPANDFAAGNRILAIGFEKTVGSWTYPFLKLDFDNNSFTASTTGPVSGSNTGNGQTSGGSYATIGDASVQFQAAGFTPETFNGQPGTNSIYTTNGSLNGGTASAAFNSHPCGSYGCAGGLPAIRGVLTQTAGGVRIFKTYFDLTTLPTAYPNTVTGGTQALGAIQNQLSMSIAMIGGTVNAEAYIKVSTQLPVTLPTYNLTGFFAPVDMGDVTNRAKAGQAIPLKFRVLDENGAPYAGLVLGDVAVTSIQSNATAGATDDIETYAGASGLQYLGDGNYQLNWKTPTSYANQTRRVRLTITDPDFLVDGNDRTALFLFRK